MAARVTQKAVTVAYTVAPDARVTQIVGEVVHNGEAECRVTMLAYEVIRSVNESAGGGSTQPVQFTIVSG